MPSPQPTPRKRRGRPPLPIGDRKNKRGKKLAKDLGVEADAAPAKTGRQRCQRVIDGKNGLEPKRCGKWAGPGSDYCSLHGGGTGLRQAEDSVQEGRPAEKAVAGQTTRAVGLRRVISGRFADLFDVVARELGDDDLGQELATARTVLMTQMEELTIRYDVYKEEAGRLKNAELRMTYWRNYGALTKSVRGTLDQIRKIVQTVSDVRAKQSGNVLSMVQVVLMVGELVTGVTEIIGDDPTKLEQLRATLNRLEWMPQASMGNPSTNE